ncbi:putative pregnancy-specific beta-1-glycoprotein 7 isoform X2 [Lates calcarifer]|uniref:Pregnancy-specific beta-1-glycoprotein 7 isoform X2 n=1 Tax=Lates calcarifer TaxID=8187 RepID=A0AAJ7LE37_LATCA|nr:putative pregnancy-specific beta-1-glycoprotein 7 isoform X2 [Lates calcarifer]
MKTLQTRNLLPILALASLFVKISGSVSLHPVLTGPDMAYLGSRVAFRCIAPNASLPVTYELIGDGGVLMRTGTDQGDQHASFFLKVTASSEGSYHCKATIGGSTGVSNIIKLTVVTPASNTRVTSEPFPPVVYEGSRIVLSCTITKGSHLSYTWLFNRKEVTSSTSPFFHLNGNQLVMEKVTPEHAGHYSCIAWSRVHDVRRFSSSTEIQVTVKVYISKPRISFSIFKVGDSYHGNVTCWSTRGSHPVNFSLSIDDKEVASTTATESLTAWFPVAMVPGRDMGVAQCQAKTEMQKLMSEPVSLEVVPVGGDVKVEVEYLYRADSKLAVARLSCQVGRGTFPYISWLFNDSVLPSETHVDSHFQPVLPDFALADRRRILILPKLGPEESGCYRCRVRDSYDDSGPWVESVAVLVKVTEVFMSTIEVIAIAFCCFLVLMMVVYVACIYRMFDRNRAPDHISTPNSDAPPVSAPALQLGSEMAATSSIDCDA